MLTDAEHHSPHRASSSAQLRAACVLHILFADEIVITDSQALNNPMIREVLAGSEPDLSLWPLLESGHLSIARREGHSFRDIAVEHRTRAVEGLPPDDYVSRLDDLPQSSLIEWALTDTSETFRAGTLSRLHEISEDGDLSSRVATEATQWIGTVDRFNYADFRQWLDRSTIPVGERQYLDVLAGLEFRHALPRTLGLPTAEPKDPLVPTAYFDLRGGDLEPVGEVPVWSLRPEVLAQLPTDLVIQARRHEDISVIKRQLHFLQTEDRRFSTDALRLSLAGIAESLDAAAAALITRDPTIQACALGQRPRLRLRVSKLSATGNGMVVADLLQTPDMLASPFGWVELLLAASAVMGDSLADRRARRSQERDALRHYSKQLAEPDRLIKSVSRAVVPTVE